MTTFDAATTVGGGSLTGGRLLRVDAEDCPGGDLATDSACRATVVDALAAGDADAIRVRADGIDHFYDGDGAALLSAAGRFVDGVALREPSLAERAKRDPLAVAHEAVGRAGPVARTVAECGLSACAERVDGYDRVLTPSVAPTVALGRTAPLPPEDGTLRETTTLDTGGRVTVYDRADGLPRYHLRPATRDLSADALAVLVAAREALATGEVEPSDRAASAAVRHVVSADATAVDDGGADLSLELLASVLDRHTRGFGVLDEVFADPRVTDASLSAPACEGAVRVVVDDEQLTTNVRLSAADVAALTARLRARSGRPLSRSSPTADAAVDGVRVAAVAAPATDGTGFAFRRRADEPWTLPRLVAVGSLPAPVAGLLSVAVERGAAVLVAGPRGAGKTSLLGALCFALDRATRSVVIEDTPELPVESLTRAGRDVQSLRVATDDDAALSPTDAVRTALRLGEGALVVGEVRGGEARALYEAMRVGAAADAVLGTIHGTGGQSVRERVVSDLGVPASSFATTDLVVTLGPDRALDAVEEVHGGRPDDFAPLATCEGSTATVTGLLDRGESRLITEIARPTETYADVRAAATERGERIRELADAGRTGVAAVANGLDG